MNIKTHYLQEEFRKEILDKGFTDFDLKIEESYREAGWGMWECIRDFGQNALDTTESLNIYQNDDGTIIEDTGVGVQIKHFIFRTFKKEKWERGQFGEGMKLATLAALRNGYPIKFYSIEFEAYGVLVWDPLLEGWMLHIPFRKGPEFGTLKGTKITIINYFGEMYKDRFCQFIKPADISVPSTLDTRSLELYTSPVGRLYIRDIYLKDIDSEFSYNLWNFEPSPDRHGPQNPNELNIDMARLWCQIDDKSLLQKLFESIKKRRKEIESHFDDIYREYENTLIDNKTKWQRAFSCTYGKNATVDTTYGQLRARLEYCGYSSIIIPWIQEKMITWLIGSDKDKIRELIKLQSDDSKIIPLEKLTKEQLLHLNLIKWINDRIIEWPSASEINPAELPTDPTTLHKITANADIILRTINIDIAILSNFSQALQAYIHEISHIQEPNLEHHNPDFLAAIAKISAKIIRFVSTNTLPKEWEDVKW